MQGRVESRRKEDGRSLGRTPLFSPEWGCLATKRTEYNNLDSGSRMIRRLPRFLVFWTPLKQPKAL